MTFYHSPLLQKWKDVLSETDGFPSYAHDIGRNLENDVSALAHDIGFMFVDTMGVPEGTQACALALHRWHVIEQISKPSPSLAAMCLFALQGFGLGDGGDHRPVLTAAVLGDEGNNHAYHNPLHYKKVLLQVIRLIAMHNAIYKSTAQVLTANEISLLLIAACVHDLGHDGLGNTMQGVFHQGRLERAAFEKAAPFLRLAGLSDDDLRRLFVMILTTEVSPIGDVANPAAQMKAAYRYHFMGEDKTVERLNLDSDFSVLETDKRLSMMALLLHEADIATSAGLTYKVTQFETTLYRAEIGKYDAAPSHVVEFLEKVCKRQFISDAAQSLYSANMARIYELAQQDVEQGDYAYPAPEHSEFMLSLDQGGNAQNGHEWTIN